MKFISVLISAILVFGSPSYAAIFKVTPVGPENVKVRYTQGQPTLYSDMQDSALLVFSHGLNEDKRLVFDVVVFNKGRSAQNFGTENISLVGENNQPIVVFGYEELVREAERKAGWAKFWLGLAGAATIVAASQSGYSSTYGHVHSPYGTSTFHTTTYDSSIAAGNMALASDATAYGFAQIQNSLDAKRARLNNSVLRTTTVDPGFTFGGQVITDEIKGKYPRTVALRVAWGGDMHEFRFTVTKGNQPTPPIPVAAGLEATAITPAADAPGWAPAPDNDAPYQDQQDYSSPPPPAEIKPGRTIPYPAGN
jgi:hypothetical protein